ncbi:YhgE/Pip domain-containing protein [Nocardia sp. BMG111209]|uniref:YhgE/Pip domain-containing protein n=1 Tax=Nocardia sp. BMG111209 TaxID=1160137 RepID=UPI0003751174|nr:DUF3533 domain-containing protein [Nocardia sp. BMG111209]
MWRSRNLADARRWARTWALPALVVALLTALLGSTYLAYVADPEHHLHRFPVALVDSDVGAPGAANAGRGIATALLREVPADEIELRPMGVDAAEHALRQGRVYGAIIIPGDFSQRLEILAAAAVVPGDVEQPIITVVTNPRMGPYATVLVQSFAERALTAVNADLGIRLGELMQARLVPPTATVGAARIVLANPIDIVTVPDRPLPHGQGQGLTAFFYALVLVLAGFSGAMIIHLMVDAELGFAPMEYGPWYRLRPRPPRSRFAVLARKWLVQLAVAPVVSAVLLAVSAALDMPDDRPAALFLFGTLAVAAVGVTALSVLAAFGTAGLLVNLVVFIVLGVPSAGGTIPLEAVPAALSWSSSFEPLRQVYLGVRAIAFFDGQTEAGVARGTWMSLLGLAVGTVLGLVAAGGYDLLGMARAPGKLIARARTSRGVDRRGHAVCRRGTSVPVGDDS